MKTFSIGPGAQEEFHSLTACPLCGGGNFCNLWSFPGANFVECRGCSLFFQNPQPTPESLFLRYSQEYYAYEKRNEETFLKLALKGLADIGFSRTPREGQRDFLDIGCATGALIDRLAAYGWNVRGVEVCQEAAQHGKRVHGLSIHCGTVQEAPFEPESFDVVYASHVIEHLPDPVGFVCQIRQLLRPGGCFLCITPNTEGWQARKYGAAWRSALTDHVVLFSPRTLKSLLQLHGFASFRYKTWGGIGCGLAPAPLKWVMDRGAKLFGYGDVMICQVWKKFD